MPVFSVILIAFISKESKNTWRRFDAATYTINPRRGSTMSNDDLLEKIERLEKRLALVEDREAIEQVQYQYGFYLDNRMWREVADMFTDDQPSIEIGRRGNYVGKGRVYRFLLDVLGQGRWGLLKDEIINHIQLQMVTTVSDDRRSAKTRSRAIVQGNSPPGTGSMMWAEGLYENDYVREAGVWRLQRIWWVPTFYTLMAGFDRAAFQSGPESSEFPPDEASVPSDPALGRSFLPFHYVHPFTGATTPSPASRNGVPQT